MPNYNPNYRVDSFTRINDGTSSDLSQSVAQHPGWLLGVEAFSFSSLAPAYLFMFDTAGAVTTTSVPFWSGLIPFNIFVSGATNAAVGAGVIADLSGISLNNGLSYAVSAAGTVATMSTSPAGLVRVNLQIQTSSCK